MGLFSISGLDKFMVLMTAQNNAFATRKEDSLLFGEDMQVSSTDCECIIDLIRCNQKEVIK